MRVLLKPNLLQRADESQAITTHPALVAVVARLVREAGGEVWIGDGPAGPVENTRKLWRPLGMTHVADTVGARLVPFEGVQWTPHGGRDYFIARPLLEADLVIDLPKLKTHVLTLYTGAVKNLFGAIPGRRKRELHLRAPGIEEFSAVLVDVFELVPPALTILDGVLGMEGEGPGTTGTPRVFGVVAASADAVALDTVIAEAMGYHRGQVLHLSEAGRRGLGEADSRAISTVGDASVLDFGRVELATPRWVTKAPRWVGEMVGKRLVLRPLVSPEVCIGCGRCVQVCPKDAIEIGPDKVASFDLDECIGCLCCAEICPEAAIETKRSLLSRLAKIR
jgi:uncharacterized protein (DUF362 family)/NAD-dependent dihydropyrimidine dehydrogenase PreA subunit